MRVLFTTTAGTGHFHPLVPLAQAAAAAGHDVAVAGPRSVCPTIEASGLRASPQGTTATRTPNSGRCWPECGK